MLADVNALARNVHPTVLHDYTLLVLFREG